MAVFVDLDDENVEIRQDGQPPLWNVVGMDAVKAVAVDSAIARPATGTGNVNIASQDGGMGGGMGETRGEAHELVAREDPNRNSVVKALGCYP